MKMSQFKHYTPKSNLHIEESMKEIFIAGKTYSEIVRQKFNLYSTSSGTLFKDYMDTSSSEWEKDNYFTAEQVKYMALNNYNKLLTSGRCSKKDPKNTQFLALFGVAQNFTDYSKK